MKEKRTLKIRSLFTTFSLLPFYLLYSEPQIPSNSNKKTI